MMMMLMNVVYENCLNSMKKATFVLLLFCRTHIRTPFMLRSTQYAPQHRCIQDTTKQINPNGLEKGENQTKKDKNESLCEVHLTTLNYVFRNAFI